MSDSGSELRNNNEKIVKLMALLKRERNEMNFLIAKQEEEKKQIETEIEKLTFKLQLLTKSLGQRVQARNNYDRTIKGIEETYSGIVTESGKLLFTLTKEVDVLEEIMDKKTNTSSSLPRSKEGSIVNHPREKKESIPKEKKESISTEKKQSIPTDKKQSIPTEKKETPPEPPPQVPSPINEESPSGSMSSLEETTEISGDEDEDEIKAEMMTVDPEELIMTHNSEVARKIASSKQSLPEESPKTGRKTSINSDNPIKKFSIQKEVERLAPQPPSSKKALFPAVPPIHKGSDSDAELQSFREAYERQHKGSSPPSSTTGVPPSPRRGSNSRKPLKR